MGCGLIGAECGRFVRSTPLEAAVPNFKSLLVIAGISLVTTLALEKYRAKQGMR